MAQPADRDELEAIESIKKLLRAGLELGVAEAVRRIATFAPAPNDRVRSAGAKAILGSATVIELVQFVRNDPGSVFQLAKEVWSRGGPSQKKTSAEAIGKGLGFFVPHKALDAAKELASMARSGREADMVGRKAIEPVLSRSPALVERVKRLLTDNERLLRQAAIAGLVGYVARKRKYAALGVEVLLLVAEEHEKEIRAAVRYGVRKLMEIDPKATAKGIVDWVRLNPTADRVQAAAGLLARKAGDVKLAVERGVIGAVAKFNGNGASEKPAPRKKAAPKKRTTSK